MRVFDDNNVAKSGGVLFFDKHPENIFFHAVVRCVMFKGMDKVYIIDDKTFGGPLLQQYNKAIEWLKGKLQVAYKIEGTGPRKEVWDYQSRNTLANGSQELRTKELVTKPSDFRTLYENAPCGAYWLWHTKNAQGNA